MEKTFRWFVSTVIGAAMLMSLTACVEKPAPKPKFQPPPREHDSIEGYPPKQYSNAYNYFYARALQGDPAAENSLGHMYMDGRGVDADPSKAVYWYIQSANRGYRQAQVNLGVAYLYGQGVKKDIAEACHWLSEAIHQGSTTAVPFFKDNCK
jgi:TPR repeat protein